MAEGAASAVDIGQGGRGGTRTVAEDAAADERVGIHARPGARGAVLSDGKAGRQDDLRYSKVDSTQGPGRGLARLGKQCQGSGETTGREGSSDTFTDVEAAVGSASGNDALPRCDRETAGCRS